MLPRRGAPGDDTAGRARGARGSGPARGRDARGGPPSKGGAPGHAAPRARSGGDIVYGLRAGLALVAHRPEDVLAIAAAPAVRAELDETLTALPAGARRFRIEEHPEVDLERIAGTRQHEGLVVEAKPRRWASPAELGDVLARNRGVAIALDRVRNPYNIGAILRSAAFFGVDAALLGAPAPHPALAPDAVRVAEGGVEHLLLSRTTDLAETLARLRARGVRVVGADGAAKTQALGYAFRRPAMLVVGNEREGLAERVRGQCDDIIAIGGGGAVESLNVAVATGILVAELVRGRMLGA